MNLLKLVGTAAILVLVYKAGEVKGSITTAYKLSMDPGECALTKDAFDIAEEVINQYRTGKHVRIKINGRDYSVEMIEPSMK